MSTASITHYLQSNFPRQRDASREEISFDPSAGAGAGGVQEFTAGPRGGAASGLKHPSSFIAEQGAGVGAGAGKAGEKGPAGAGREASSSK